MITTQVGTTSGMESTCEGARGVIYALIDPRDKSVRYIGQTIRPKERLKQHINDKILTHKTNWIAFLKSVGFKPRMQVLLECSASELNEQEQKHIGEAIAAGARLTNCVHAGPRISKPTDEAAQNRRRQELDPTSVHTIEGEEQLEDSEYPPEMTDEEVEKMVAIDAWLEAQNAEAA